MPPALKTDQHPITFSDRNDFDAAQLIHLYRQAPWAKHRALEQAQAMLAKTDVVISAWDGTRLVGFGRVLTDYVFRASIWDVIVDREYQKRKIGTEIVRRILIQSLSTIPGSPILACEGNGPAGLFYVG